MDRQRFPAGFKREAVRLMEPGGRSPKLRPPGFLPGRWSSVARRVEPRARAVELRARRTGLGSAACRA
jgi:hypothetical protein